MTTILELAARLQSADAIETMLLVIAKATLIMAIARLMLMTMPRASAAAKHAVATAALVAVAAMPVMTGLVPAWNMAVIPSEARSPQPEGGPSPSAGLGMTSKTVGATDAEDNERSAATAGAGLGAAISIAKASGVVPDEPLTWMSRAMNILQTTWKGLLALSLVAMTLVMLAQMVLGIIGVWFVAKNAEELTQDSALLELDHARDALALDRDIKLLRSSRISVPVLWGVFKPVLLLPADVVTWPAERLRVVLLHELAHLKRYDGLSLILTRIAVSIFWYHPLAWSLERAGRSECERACDDLVLAGGTRPSEYADHLLAIARSMPSFDPFRSVTLAMSRKSQLEGRLLSILQPQVVRRAFSGRNVAVACALAVAVIIPFSALRLTAEPPDRQQVAEKAKTKSDSTVNVDASDHHEDHRSDEHDVAGDLEALEDYFLAKLGKYDKRADRFLREPKDAEGWYERAYDLYRNDRYEEAAAAFRKAAEMGYAEAKSLYNAACSWALLGNATRATETLAAAIDAGWDDFEHIAEDSDFDPIRRDPGFQRLVQRGGADVATRRVDETMARYRALQQGVAGGVAGGVSDGVREGARGDIADNIAEAIAHAVGGKHKAHKEWFDVGLDLLRLRQFDESINAFQKSIEEGEKVGTAMYNIACAYSLKGDARSGMAWLDKAIENGFSSDEKLMNDPDIALLRTQPGFEALREKAEDLEMKGCCDDASDWIRGSRREGWREAAEHHRRIAQKHPDSGRAWFNLGYAALQARDFPTGHDAFQRAINLNYRVGTSSYNIACGYALQGNRDAAFQWLDRARDAGFELRSYLEDDEDLESLHNDPRWDALRDEVGTKQAFRWKGSKSKSR